MEVIKGQLQGILLSKLHVEMLLFVPYHNSMDVHLTR